MDELQRVAVTLEEAAIQYALIGGLAFSLYVEPRATEDIDFLIHEDDWDKVVSALAWNAYKEIAGPMRFAKAHIRRLTKFADGDAVVLDFVLQADRTDLESSIRLRVGDAFIQVARPTVIIRLKEARMSDKDIADIAALKNVTEPQ